MRFALVTLLCGVACLNGPTAAQGQRVGWDSMDTNAAAALYAFRQTNHWIAEAISENLDGKEQGPEARLGRVTAAGRPLNFDPSRHLLYIVRDLNGDGLPEVFLLFTWYTLHGSQPSQGVVMVQGPIAGDWRIGCDFYDWGNPNGPGGSIRLLPAPRHQWRGFVTSNARYAWRPANGRPDAVECMPVADPPPSGRASGRPGTGR